MKHQTGEKVNTKKYGVGTIISTNERQNAYLIRWLDNRATWVKEKDIKA